jgi:hypothetical protein
MEKTHDRNIWKSTSKPQESANSPDHPLGRRTLNKTAEPAIPRYGFAAPCMWLALIVTLVSCASFEPRLHQSDLLKRREPTVKANQNDIDVSIEEFANPEKSILAFEATVSSYGVLPLLVQVKNSGATNYRLPRNNVNALLNGDPLTLLDGRDAATQSAMKGYGGNALAWTLATGPFALLVAPLTLTASSAHTASVNQSVEAHFARLELPDALIRQNDSIAGFVYFKLPVATWRLENLVVAVEPVNDETGEVLSYKFSLPVIDIPVPPEMREKKVSDDN